MKKNKKTKLRSRLGQQESIGSTLKNHQSHTIEHRVIKRTTPTTFFVYYQKKKGQEHDLYLNQFQHPFDSKSFS